MPLIFEEIDKWGEILLNEILGLFSDYFVIIWLLLVVVPYLFEMGIRSLQKNKAGKNTLVRKMIKIVNTVSSFLLIGLIQLKVTTGFLTKKLIWFLLDKTVWGTIVFIGVFLTLWFLFSDENGGSLVKYYNVLFTDIGIINPNDIQTYNFISGISKIFLIALPIAAPFYYFTYREQKAASAGDLISKTNSVVFFVFFAALSLVFAFFLNRILVQYGVTDSLLVSSQERRRIIVWAICTGCSIYFGYRTIKELIRTINLKWILSEVIKKIDSMFFDISFVVGLKARKRMYFDLHTHSEMVYQMLSLCIEKHIDRVFEENYKKWMSVLLNLFESERLKYIDKKVMYEKLLDDDAEEFKKLYRSILEKHIALIMTCYKSHKTDRGKKCILSLLNLNPREDSLRSIYLEVVNDLAVFLFNGDSDAFSTLLGGLELVSAENKLVEKNGIIMIYKTLVLKAVEKDKPKLLSTVVNSFYRSVDTPSKLRSVELASDTVKKLQMAHLNRWVTTEDDSDKSCAFILLQVALKGVELSRHECVGYIIKFIATHFESDLIAGIYRDFVRNKGGNNPNLHQRDLYSSIDLSFPFNQRTLDYCLAKLSILLYGHQTYLSQNKIVIGIEQRGNINISLVDIEYNDYLFRSITEMKSKYGLWFLGDSEFMKELQKLVGIAFSTPVTTT